MRRVEGWPKVVKGFSFVSSPPFFRENENERRNANESRQQSDVELVKLQSFFIGWKEGEKR